MTAPRQGRVCPLARVLVLAALAATLGCAGPRPASTAPAETWRVFTRARAMAALSGAGLAARASLQYQGPDRNSRVLLKLWGNMEYPLRLDMEAGIGSTIALMREDAAGWMAYLPGAKQAVAAEDARLGLRALGVDAPLSLRDLAVLAAGTYQGLAPGDYDAAEPAQDGGWRYAFHGPGPLASMTLDPAGRPTSMTGTFLDRPWSLVLSDRPDDSGPGEPARKLVLERPPDTRVVLRIKELERRPEPWPMQALALEPPPGTRLLSPADAAPETILP